MPVQLVTTKLADCVFRGALLSGVLLAVMTITSGVTHAANKSRLSIYQHGKPVSYMPCGSQTLSSRSAVLMGGGRDIPEAFTFMIDKMASCADGSKGKPGNFVVIRAGGNPSYDSYIFKQGPVASVITIVVPDRESAAAVGDATNEVGQQVQALLKTAGAIWLTGGDQGDYYNFWKGTAVERLISGQALQFGIPVGGTSAGMMILSEYNFIPDLAYSSEYALLNPAYMKQWLKNDFWTAGSKTPFPPLTTTVTDSHFDTRNRMGRLITFLANTVNMGWTSPSSARAIGVDQETALLMAYQPTKAGNTGIINLSMRIVANEGSAGAAYLLTPSQNSTIDVPEATSLTFTKVKVQKFFLNAEKNTVSSTYEINAGGGTLTSSSGSIY